MFNEEQLKNLKKLVRLYLDLKEIILSLEESDPEKRTTAQVLLEYRDTLDHLMRILSLRLNIRPDFSSGIDEDEYIKQNLNKAFDHLFRASYDALDISSLTIREKIEKELRGFEVEAITKAVPSYYSTIRPELEGINERIAEIRGCKDIGRSDLEDFSSYLQCIKKLKGYLREILRAKPSLIEISEKTKKTKRKDTIIGGIIGIIVTVIGGLCLYILLN